MVAWFIVGHRRLSVQASPRAAAVYVERQQNHCRLALQLACASIIFSTGKLTIIISKIKGNLKISFNFVRARGSTSPNDIDERRTFRPRL